MSYLRAPESLYGRAVQKPSRFAPSETCAPPGPAVRTPPIPALPIKQTVEPLATALGASHAVVSLHFPHDDTAQLLAEWNSCESDQDDSLTALHSVATRHHRAAEESTIEGATLSIDDTAGARILHIPFDSDDGSTKVIISASFGPGKCPDRKLVGAVLRRLGPMLGAYLRLWQTHREQACLALGMRAALDSIDLGVILFDQSGAVMHVNAAAETLLCEGSLLRRRNRTVATSDLADTMRLQSVIAQAIATNASQNDDAAIARPIQLDRACSLLRITSAREQLILTALPAQQAASAPGQVAAMLILLRPGSDTAAAIAPICKLYGLSAVETQLACKLIAGSSLLEAASALRIKEQTARSYLKQVFLKTDVKRQADLVRLLLSSLLRTRTVSLHCV